MLNHRQASTTLEIDGRTLSKLILENEIPYEKRGKEKLYREEDIEQLKSLMDNVTPTSESKVFVISSPKGGTAKTTTIKYLSKILSNEGKKVLVVDADPQHYYTDFIVGGWTDEDKIKTRKYNLLTLVLGKTKLIKTTLPAFENVDFIAGTRKLEYYDKELSDVMGRELAIKKVISSALSKYDYILIDTSPSQGSITLAALLSAHVVITPVIPDVDSLEASKDLLGSINKILEGNLSDKFKLNKIYILPTKQKSGFGSAFQKQILTDIQEEFSDGYILNLDISILDAIMDYKNIPEESYQGVLNVDTKSYKNYYNSTKEVFNLG